MKKKNKRKMEKGNHVRVYVCLDVNRVPLVPTIAKKKICRTVKLIFVSN